MLFTDVVVLVRRMYIQLCDFTCLSPCDVKFSIKRRVNLRFIVDIAHYVLLMCSSLCGIFALAFTMRCVQLELLEINSHLILRREVKLSYTCCLAE